MYPNAPNFRSGEPGSAWWIIQLAEGPRVAITQWDVVVRVFQRRAKQLLEALQLPTYYRAESGQCPTGFSTLTAWSDLASLYAGSTNVRRTDQITVDGQFGPETADLLWFMLCLTGQTQRAEEWAAAIAQRVIPIEFVRQMVWFAFYVTALSGDPQRRPVYAASVEGMALSIPSNASPPEWTGHVTSAPADVLWVGEFRPGVDPLPVAPSRSGVLAPVVTVDQPAMIPLGVTIGVALGAGLLTWWLTSAPKNTAWSRGEYGA